MHVVRGNCDIDDRFPLEELFPIEDAKVFVVHGHKYNVKSTLMPLFYRAQEVQASVVCFGHSHLLGAEMQKVFYLSIQAVFSNPVDGKKKATQLLREMRKFGRFVLFR